MIGIGLQAGTPPRLRRLALTLLLLLGLCIAAAPAAASAKERPVREKRVREKVKRERPVKERKQSSSPAGPFYERVAYGPKLGQLADMADLQPAAAEHCLALQLERAEPTAEILARPKAIILPAKVLDRYAGQYLTDPGKTTTATFAREGDHLTVSYSFRPRALVLNAISETQFDLPFTLENRISDNTTPVLERSLPVRAIGAPLLRERLNGSAT